MASNQVSRYAGSKLSRHDFPQDFLFGTATAAYQVEGAFADGRRSLSNWDNYSMQTPNKIADGSNGCVATDHYNKYKEDVALMKKLGIDTYRLSIAWSRILPGGRLSAGVNKEGVKFYNDLINLLVSEGIEPAVTIFHFDIPQCLEDQYGGFLSSRIVQDFAEYAEVCFYEFGDRVKNWMTINEAWTYTNHGYVIAHFPPGRGTRAAQLEERCALGHRCCAKVDRTCYGGDAGTEPYIVAHNLILAHAAAVDIYKKNYQAVQGGKIGIANMTTWYKPYTQSPEDVAAASRALDFMWGWFTDPIVTGDYPRVMRERVGNRLPKFTEEQKALVKGSYDFIGVNYYTSNWAANNPTPPGTPPTYVTDQEVTLLFEKDGIPIGEQTGSGWLFSVPQGLLGLLRHIKDNYNDPEIYITENGCSDRNIPSLTVTEARKDDVRTRYLQDHLASVKQAIDDGVQVKGYMLWSLFDNYEWAEGYTARFGIYYVDFINNYIRYPKESAIWYMNFLNRNLVPASKLLPASKRQVEEIGQDNTGKRKRTR